MTIDIIDFGSDQFAALNESQLREVRLAQGEKDVLTASFESAKEREYYRILRNGTIRSDLYEQACERLQEKYDREVERIKNSLLFYLQYSMRGSDVDANNAPYFVNFGLEYEERFVIVRDYYMNTYSDPIERYETYRLDFFAGKYLGEYHGTLSAYLRELAEEAGWVG